MSISIKRKIYISFTWLILLFVGNGLITIVTLYNNKKLSWYINEVVDPSLQAMNDFRKMMVDSKIYSTNWVFLRFNQNDKEALIKLHRKDYKDLKSRLNTFSAKWKEESWKDSLNKVYVNFEELMLAEKKIIGSLVQFEDYDDPLVKLEAERIVEDEIIPRTVVVMHSLERVIEHEQNIRIEESKKLETSLESLRSFIEILAFTFVCLGIFLSVYFAKVIIKPLERIKNIINDLGKGITQLIPHHTNKDEISEMVLSVNNLSKNQQRTATFAREVGNRNFNISFKPLSENDTLGKALVAMRDNLKQSDAQLHEAQHIAQLGSWERDIKTNKITWSDEMFSIFGLDPFLFDSNQQTFLNAVHPEDLARVKQLSRENPNDHQPISYECRIITPKGVIKTIYVEDKVFLNGHGQLVKTSGIAQDITERKKASLELEDTHAQLKRLLENIDQAFFSVDLTSGKFLQMSAASEKIFGYKCEDFLEDYDLLKSLTHEDDFDVVEKAFAPLFSGLTVQNEYRITHKDGSIRWVEVKVVPTLDASGKAVRLDGVAYDIGKRKTAELQRDRTTSDLILRNKDLEQFTYIVSHNLRAPVANIIALSELLNLTTTDKGKGNGELLNGLSVSIRSLDSILLDLNQILAVRTPGYEKKEMVSLFTIVENIRASIKHLIDEEGVIIDCDFTEPEEIFTLRSYIYSIFYNLILNSIKYKQAGASPRISIKSSTLNKKITISFMDNGKGIDLKKNGKDLFMLYKRFDTTVEGKGLGLYMIKTAVETLGGNISVESKVNVGSEFRVELPGKPEEVKVIDGVDAMKVSTENFVMLN